MGREKKKRAEQRQRVIVRGIKAWFIRSEVKDTVNKVTTKTTTQLQPLTSLVDVMLLKSKVGSFIS